MNDRGSTRRSALSAAALLLFALSGCGIPTLCQRLVEVGKGVPVTPDPEPISHDQISAASTLEKVVLAGLLIKSAREALVTGNSGSAVTALQSALTLVNAVSPPGSSSTAVTELSQLRAALTAAISTLHLGSTLGALPTLDGLVRLVSRLTPIAKAN